MFTGTGTLSPLILPSDKLYRVVPAEELKKK